MTRLLELFPLLILPAFLLLDRAYRARRYPELPGWRPRALAVSVAAFALSIGVTSAWALLIGDFAVLPGERLGTLVGAIVGVLAYELCHYVYHRAAHESDWLWRWSHQMHHSAESLDAWGAYYLSPLDVIAFTSLSSLMLFPVLGLSLEAGLLAGAFLAFNAVFQHANIRTPRWLGYLIQRPESHAVHHSRGVHRYNYSDLPLWDLLFGTFRNPHAFDGAVGFHEGASRSIVPMLLGRDVARDAVPARDPSH